MRSIRSDKKGTGTSRAFVNEVVSDACSEPVPFLSEHRACRREFLQHFSTGLGGMALASLLTQESAGGPVSGEAADPPPHHLPKARRAIQIFLQGGLSQVDTFDYKPQLEKLHGQPVPGDQRPQAFMGKVGLLHRPHFAFKQRGESGLWVSDLFPGLAEVADELTVIKSMW